MRPACLQLVAGWPAADEEDEDDHEDDEDDHEDDDEGWQAGGGLAAPRSSCERGRKGGSVCVL